MQRRSATAWALMASSKVAGSVIGAAPSSACAFGDHCTTGPTRSRGRSGRATAFPQGASRERRVPPLAGSAVAAKLRLFLRFLGQTRTIALASSSKSPFRPERAALSSPKAPLKEEKEPWFSIRVGESDFEG